MHVEGLKNGDDVPDTSYKIISNFQGSANGQFSFAEKDGKSQQPECDREISVIDFTVSEQHIQDRSKVNEQRFGKNRRWVEPDCSAIE